MSPVGTEASGSITIVGPGGEKSYTIGAEPGSIAKITLQDTVHTVSLGVIILDKLTAWNAGFDAAKVVSGAKSSVQTVDST